MNDSFKPISFEGFSSIAKAMEEFPSNFCDYTPFVILTWQKYYDSAFAIINGYPILRYTVEGQYYYSPLTRDIVGAAKELLDGSSPVTLSVITEEDTAELKKSFCVSDIECDDGWADYIYAHSDLAEFSGKKYSGQRNHINKFTARYTDWCYEEINEGNLSRVADFYRELTTDTSEYNETALYERERLLEYLSGGFYKLPMLGGLITANGEIVSFAFGEIIKDMLYVHTEKARRDVQGAYQMIVREFARHNPASLINREEDMGIEGLRTSKKSYHPIRLERKYKICLEKRI